MESLMKNAEDTHRIAIVQESFGRQAGTPQEPPKSYSQSGRPHNALSKPVWTGRKLYTRTMRLNGISFNFTKLF